MSVEWTWIAVDRDDRVLVFWTDKRGAYPPDGVLLEDLAVDEARALSASLRLDQPPRARAALYFVHPMSGPPDTFVLRGGQGALTIQDLPPTVRAAAAAWRLDIDGPRTPLVRVSQWLPRDRLTAYDDGDWDAPEATPAATPAASTAEVDLFAAGGRMRLPKRVPNASPPRPAPTDAAPLDRRPPLPSDAPDASGAWATVGNKRVRHDVTDLHLSGALSERDLQTLATLSALETLHLDHARFDPRWLAHLGALTALRTLSLDHTEVRDDDLGFLAALPHLTHVSLVETRATEACARHLGGRAIHLRLADIDWSEHVDG